MIQVSSLAAKGDLPNARGAVLLRNVSFTWERGVLAVLGAPYDGTTLLLQVLAGHVRARGGSVSVKEPIAHVPVDVVLPDALRVDEACELAGELRGEPRKHAPERLAPLGLEALASRRVRSLSPAEARGVALAIALSSTAPVLLIEEPLAMIEPTVPSRVAAAIRARASAGAAVIVTTASVRDATTLADRTSMLTRGVLAPVPEPLAHAGPGGSSMRVVLAPSDDARAHASALVAALTGDAAVAYVEAAGAVTVVARGPELAKLASAVTRAVAAARVEVEAIETAVMPLDAIRAAMGGVS